MDNNKKNFAPEDKPVWYKCKDPFPDELHAIRALSKGEADARQQYLALTYIVNSLCRPHDHCFIEESDRGSVFLSGRAFVGQVILRMLNTPVNQQRIRKEAETNEPSSK